MFVFIAYQLVPPLELTIFVRQHQQLLRQQQQHLRDLASHHIEHTTQNDHHEELRRVNSVQPAIQELFIRSTAVRSSSTEHRRTSAARGESAIDRRISVRA